MGIDDDQAKSALRVSFGWDSKDGDVDAFLNAWGDLYERIHKDGKIAQPAA